MLIYELNVTVKLKKAVKFVNPHKNEKKILA